MRRLPEEQLSVSMLDDLARIHDDDAAGETSDDRECARIGASDYR